MVYWDFYLVIFDQNLTDTNWYILETNITGKIAKVLVKCWFIPFSILVRFSRHLTDTYWYIVKSNRKHEDQLFDEKKKIIYFINCCWILNVIFSFKIYFSFLFCSDCNLKATVVKTDEITGLKQLFTPCFLLIAKKVFF